MSGEKAMHEQLSAWLRKNGFVFFHSRMDKPTSQTCGDPDFAIFRDGKVAFCELKQPKGKLSPAQIKRFDELAAVGFAVKIAYSAGQAIGYVDMVFGLWRAGGPPAKPETVQGAALDALMSARTPQFWWTYSSSLKDNVVVARNTEGHLGAIRIAKESDIEKFPRLPREMA